MWYRWSEWLSFYLFFFMHKTAYEMRMRDWSSDVCSSDLDAGLEELAHGEGGSNHLESFFRLNLRRPLSSACMPGWPWTQKNTGATHRLIRQIGRASCRARVRQYVKIAAVAESLKKTIKTSIHDRQFEAESKYKINR